jgi:hypothetical protein
MVVRPKRRRPVLPPAHRTATASTNRTATARPLGPRWDAGSFDDPRTGRGHGLTATLTYADVLVAHVMPRCPYLSRPSPT